MHDGGRLDHEVDGELIVFEDELASLAPSIRGGSPSIVSVRPVEADTKAAVPGGQGARWPIRLALVLVLLVALGAIGRASGVRRLLRVSTVRARMAGLGPGGHVLAVLAFVGAFCVGELLQVPAPLFILLAAVTWGRWLGALLSWLGALAAVVTSFLVVRAVGGRSLSALPSARVQRALAALERAPVRGIALIWTAFWVVPYVNYAIALTPVGLRDYVLGSAIGLVPPVCGLALAFDAILPLIANAELVT
jgi:uncharacterized membrane protein YdjX (TVP38/TMEM64 family)